MNTAGSSPRLTQRSPTDDASEHDESSEKGRVVVCSLLTRPEAAEDAACAGTDHSPDKASHNRAAYVWLAVIH